MNPSTVAGHHSWLRRHAAALFLVALALAIATSPFEEQVKDGDLIEAARLTLVLLSSFLAVGSRRRDIAWGLVLMIPALVSKWASHFRPDIVPAWVFLLPSLAFLIFVIALLLRFILRAPRIDSEVLCAGMATYLMLGLLWSLAYILVARLAPGSFEFASGSAASRAMRGSTATYYSFITLTTVGYGDITPLSGAARMLSIMEAMIGMFYVAVLIARLVAAYPHTQSAAPATSGNQGLPPDPDPGPECKQNRQRTNKAPD